MNVNIPFCVDEETQARMGATPAWDHTAAPPGTPVWLASALLFLSFSAACQLSQHYLTGKEKGALAEETFLPWVSAFSRHNPELGRNWGGSAPLTGACGLIPEPTPQVPREETQSVVCRLPLPLPLSTNWSSYPRIQPSSEAGIYVLMC